MLLVLNIEVKIAGLTFKRVESVTIESSAKVLEDRATITIPRTARLTRQGQFLTEVETAKEFPTGSEVVIKMGYNGNLVEEFRGYVKCVKPGSPVTIECEDAVYLLRKKYINKSWKTVTLKSVIEEILRGTGIKLLEPVPVINFAPFYIKNTNAAAALQKLKDSYGLIIRVVNGAQLYVGFTERLDATRRTLKITENVIDDNLEWVDEIDVNLKVKATSWLPNNTSITVEVGDPNGDARSLHFYNITSKAELRQIATRELRKYKYSGLKGNLRTFLTPPSRVGETALIRDPIFPQRDGDYLIDKVVTTFNTSGGRRTIYPGLKVSA